MIKDFFVKYMINKGWIIYLVHTAILANFILYVVREFLN